MCKKSQAWHSTKNSSTGQIFLQEQPAMPPPASAENEHDLPTDTVTSKAASRKPKKSDLNQALCRVCRQRVEAVISMNLVVAAHQSEVNKGQRMKKELVALSRTVKSACQATREAKKIAKVSEDKLKEVEGTLKAERDLHYYNIELEKASSTEALIMAVQSEKDAVA